MQGTLAGAHRDEHVVALHEVDQLREVRVAEQREGAVDEGQRGVGVGVNVKLKRRTRTMQAMALANSTFICHLHSCFSS